MAILRPLSLVLQHTTSSLGATDIQFDQDASIQCFSPFRSFSMAIRQREHSGNQAVGCDPSNFHAVF